MKKISSKSIALIGVFAALHVALYTISIDLWRNWSIYPRAFRRSHSISVGWFLRALVGSIVTRTIKPIKLWMFGIIAGLMFSGVQLAKTMLV